MHSLSGNGTSLSRPLALCGFLNLLPPRTDPTCPPHPPTPTPPSKAWLCQWTDIYRALARHKVSLAVPPPSNLLCPLFPVNPLCCNLTGSHKQLSSFDIVAEEERTQNKPFANMVVSVALLISNLLFKSGTKLFERDKQMPYSAGCCVLWLQLGKSYESLI